MSDAELNHFVLSDRGDYSRHATEQDKARAKSNFRRWPKALSDEMDMTHVNNVWFGNEGDDIDPRFERDETL